MEGASLRTGVPWEKVEGKLASWGLYKGDRMGADNFRNLRLLSSVAGSDGVRHQFTTLFDYGVFDKFPRLKVLVLECGAGWVGYWPPSCPTSRRCPDCSR